MPEEYVVVGNRLEETGDAAGARAMQQLLQLPEPPDAVFCYNDLTAIGAMGAALAAGLRVPEDIAFIGCGNMRYNGYLKVPLSSIDHGTAELGRIAGELALELVSNPEQPPKSILVPPTLVARASTVPAKELSTEAG
jgi:LacI family transcriptional regulator